MATSVAEQLVEDLRDSGVQRIYGLVVTREEIMAAAHSPQRYSSVRELMKTNVPTISSEADLFEEALPILHRAASGRCPSPRTQSWLACSPSRMSARLGCSGNRRGSERDR
jgi:hypothetical protein